MQDYITTFGTTVLIITLKSWNYRNDPKFSDTQKMCCNHSKVWTMWLYHRVMSPNNADGMENSVDPDQTAPLGAVWSGSALFAQICLSKNLGSLRYYSWVIIKREKVFSEISKADIFLLKKVLKFQKSKYCTGRTNENSFVICNIFEMLLSSLIILLNLQEGRKKLNKNSLGKMAFIPIIRICCLCELFNQLFFSKINEVIKICRKVCVFFNW